MLAKKLPDDLGNAVTGEVRLAAVEAFGRDADVSLTPLEQLCAKVVAVAKARLSDDGKAAEEACAQFAIFVLSTQPRIDRQRLKAVRVPNVATGSQRLAGHVWIVSPTLAAAGRLDLSTTAMGEAFDSIENLGLGSYPAVVVEFTSRQLAIYRQGVAAEEDRMSVEMSDDDLDDVSMQEQLTKFLGTCIETPNCQSQIKTWNDGANYIPVRAAEKNIQELLFMFLRARLVDTHKVDLEVTMRSGRLDILIRKRISQAVWKMAVALELKVARSFSCTGKPKSHLFLQNHIARGYRQIREYRRELEAEEGWLVAYDMRTLGARDKDPFAAHLSDAKMDGLSLLLQPLYGTADDFRDHQTT